MDYFIEEYLKAIGDIMPSRFLYVTGGFVRDYLLGRKIKELEIVTTDDGMPIGQVFAQQHRKRYQHLNGKHGGVRVVLNDPDLVIDFISIKEKDMALYLGDKDFTIHAMALPVLADGQLDQRRMIDPHNGQDDLKNKIIRNVSADIFERDPLSMLQAVRLMAELQFDIDHETMKNIKEKADGLAAVTPEEITEELFRILKCRRTHHYFNIMDKYLNILNKIFPEIEPMKDVGRCKYHVVDSWTHSLYTLNVAESIIYADGYFEYHLRRAYEEHTKQILCHDHTRLELIKLAALFHDVGKPAARKVDDSGRVRFRGHEILGMEIMGQIADRLKFCLKEKEFLCKLVREHMWPLILYKENNVSGKALYDLFKNFGEDTLDVLLVSLADIIATRKLLHPHEEMGMYKVHIEYLANNYLTRFKNIINISHILQENDITEHFMIQGSEEIAAVMEAVRKAIFFGRIPPEKPRALQYIKEEVIENLRCKSE